MRLTVELGGRTTVVDVADDLASVRVEGRTYPARVVARTPLRVELEIAGEAVVVDGWPEHEAEPPGPLDVNGERGAVGVRIDVGARASGLPLPRPSDVPPPAPSAPTAPSHGAAIVPPMPGKVVEVRVKDGERVAKGAVLLVVEAMKMRNEVTSPVDGVVRGLAVKEGSNVRAREAMLVVAPD